MYQYASTLSASLPRTVSAPLARRAFRLLAATISALAICSAPALAAASEPTQYDHGASATEYADGTSTDDTDTFTRVEQGANYASVGGERRWVEVCDMEEDGNGVYGQFKLRRDAPEEDWLRVGDPTGSDGGCGNAEVTQDNGDAKQEIVAFRVCEDDWGEASCSGWKEPDAGTATPGATPRDEAGGGADADEADADEADEADDADEADADEADADEADADEADADEADEADADEAKSLPRVEQGANYASVGGERRWVEVCDMEPDGNGVYGQFKLRRDAPEEDWLRVGDPTGSDGGCGNREADQQIVAFRVCENDLVEDSCSGWNEPTALNDRARLGQPLPLTHVVPERPDEDIVGCRKGDRDSIKRHQKTFRGLETFCTRGYIQKACLDANEECLTEYWTSHQKERAAQAFALNELDKRRESGPRRYADDYLGSRTAIHHSVDWEVGRTEWPGFRSDIVTDEQYVYEVKDFKNAADAEADLQKNLPIFAVDYNTPMERSKKLQDWAGVFKVNLTAKRDKHVYVWGKGTPAGHLYFTSDRKRVPREARKLADHNKAAAEHSGLRDDGIPGLPPIVRGPVFVP